MLGLCYILYRESRLTLTLTACPRWFVLCPVWSSPFDKLLAGSHFLHVESAYTARPDCHLCGLTQGEFFSRLVFFPARLSDKVLFNIVLPLWELHADMVCWHPGTRMHRCVACTKVMEIILLTNPQILKYGCCHFVARWVVIILGLSSTYIPSSPSTEITKG